MIRFEQPSNENPFGKIICEINQDFPNFKQPFRFQVINTTDGKLKWESNGMFLGWWSIYVEPCNTIARLTDSNGDLIDEWKWETEKHGDESHKMLLDWSLNNKGSKGIAIGTNDGSTGEWVHPLRNGLIDGILVEASETAYNLLVDNYKDFKNARTMMSLITPDGGDIEFFESINGEGFTNSTSK